MSTLIGQVALCVCLCAFHVLVNISAQSLENSISLMDDLLDKYDRRQRPVADQSGPINVNVSFDLIAIRDFNELEEKFSVVGILYMAWYDEAIKWNPWLYGGSISQMFPLYDVWYPIVVLSNPYDSIADVADPEWMTVRIYANGFALFTPGAVFRSTCMVDVTFYPFDTQTCVLYFAPWGYLPTEVTLTPFTDKVLQTYFTESGEWSLLDTAVFTFPNSNTLAVSFTFRRKPMFTAVNVLLPIMLMSVINMLVFLVPHKSGERISYAITVLLALAVFLTLVGDNLPKTSEPVAILSFYLLSILIISVLICVVAISNMNVYFRSKKIVVPAWCVFVTRLLQCRCLRRRKIARNSISPERSLVVNVASVDATIKDTTDVAGMVGSHNRNSNNNNNSSSGSNEDMYESEATCTWKDVGAAVDKISIAFFSVAILGVNLVFIMFMTSA